MQIDQEILNGKIIAYQIRWFNGNWSNWFVPGVNDLDHKYNPSNNTMRRMWSYFSDHEHKYIICKSKKDIPPSNRSEQKKTQNPMIINQSPIRQFYEETFLPEIRKLTEDNLFHKWRDNPLICLGYLELGSLEFVTESPDYLQKLDYVKVKQLPSTIPSSVIDSFNDHSVTSQTRLLDIYVLRVPVNEEDTYAIIIDGYVDDGWDQETHFLEVYNSQGEIVGSCRGIWSENFSIKWEDRPFNIDDIDFGYDEVQIWSEDDIECIS